ncbi:unnamed protein product [Rhizoctonia solani]|uniref:Uncharacterized protein n=1 Tax=Rhizoctonia solani TaxID=456999 RepID=A0A8H2WX33_9AGAM|nr:unnamed protein product [Rhizoctonia solani]
MTESSFEKEKIAQKLAEIKANLPPHIVADNEQFDRLFSPLEENTQNLPQRFIEQAQYIRNMGKRLYWGERAHLSRSQNSRARKDTATLVALPLPNGGYPAEGEFPSTLGEFRSLEGPALAALLRLYELPHQDQAADARSTLSRYFSIPI